jgi:hypothetical protein
MHARKLYLSIDTYNGHVKKQLLLTKVGPRSILLILFSELITL